MKVTKGPQSFKPSEDCKLQTMINISIYQMENPFHHLQLKIVENNQGYCKLCLLKNLQIISNNNQVTINLLICFSKKILNI